MLFGMLTFHVLSLLIVATLFYQAEPSRNKCQTCADLLDTFVAEVKQKDDNILSNQEKLRKEFMSFCAKFEENSPQERVCYAVGGRKESATYILNDILKPLAYGKPSLKICEEAHKQTQYVCIEEEEIDLDTIVPKKMNMKELRRVLSKLGGSCKDCIEKAEFVKALDELLIKKKVKKAEL